MTRLLSSTALLALCFGNPALAQGADGTTDLGMDCDRPRYNAEGKLILDTDNGARKIACEADRSTALTYSRLVATTRDRISYALRTLPPPLLFDFIEHLERQDPLKDWKITSLAGVPDDDQSEHFAEYWRDNGIFGLDDFDLYGLYGLEGADALEDWSQHLRAMAIPASNPKNRGRDIIVWLDPDILRDRWTPQMVQRTTQAWIEADQRTGSVQDHVPGRVETNGTRKELILYNGDARPLDDGFTSLPDGVLALPVLHTPVRTLERQPAPCAPGTGLIGHIRRERLKINGVYVKPVLDGGGQLTDYVAHTGDEHDAWYQDPDYGYNCRPPRDQKYVLTTDCDGSLNGRPVKGAWIETYRLQEYQLAWETLDVDGARRIPDIGVRPHPDDVVGGTHEPYRESNLFCINRPVTEFPDTPPPVDNDPTVTNWEPEDCRTTHGGRFNEGTRDGFIQRYDYPEGWPGPNPIIVRSVEDHCFRPVEQSGSQTRTLQCPATYSGAITETRRFRWWNRDWPTRSDHPQTEGDRTEAQAIQAYDADPAQSGRQWYDQVQLTASWTITSNTCRPSPPPRPNSGSSGGSGGGRAYDTDGDGTTDSHSPNADGSHYGTANDTGRPASGPGSSGRGSNPGKGRGGGGGGRGGCFLTTAIVDRRGEADDGPTLTTLRAFRDGWMAAHPDGTDLIKQYYEIAPQIVAAIPQTHEDWHWIEAQVDRAVEQIRFGEEERAFSTYCAMVRRLMRDWGPTGAAA